MKARLRVGDKEFDSLTEAVMYQKALKVISSVRQGSMNKYMLYKGKWYRIDPNFNPPKVEEIKE